MRHPKKCQNFGVSGKCRYIDCAYLHVKDEDNSKIYALEMEVKELREEVQKLMQNRPNKTNHKIEMHEKEITVLNYEVNQLNSNIKQMKLMLDEITKKATIETNNKDEEPGVWFCCKICN